MVNNKKYGKKLLGEIREEAQLRYHKGWAIVNDQWTDLEILEVIEWAQTRKGAINRVEAILNAHPSIAVAGTRK